MDDLEKELGVHLLNRGPRNFSATEIGSSIFERGQRIKDELSAIKALAERRTNHPAGVLRITCPAILAEVLVVDFAVTFAKRYPDVLLTLNVSGGSFETRIEHYDLAIQPARETLANSELVRQRLVGAPYYLIAAPDLMRSLGKLPTLGGLNHCPGIGLAADGYASRWKLVSRAGKTAELNVALAINANNHNDIKQAALNGFGLARLPQIMCEAELRDGRLILPLPN